MEWGPRGPRHTKEALGGSGTCPDQAQAGKSFWCLCDMAELTLTWGLNLTRSEGLQVS